MGDERDDGTGFTFWSLLAVVENQFCQWLARGNVKKVLQMLRISTHSDIYIYKPNKTSIIITFAPTIKSTSQITQKLQPLA